MIAHAVAQEHNYCFIVGKVIRGRTAPENAYAQGAVDLPIKFQERQVAAKCHRSRGELALDSSALLPQLKQRLAAIPKSMDSGLSSYNVLYDRNFSYVP